MSGSWQDLRYGWRTLLQQRGFTVVAVLSLALGIGVNVAIFSFAYALLLRPFPVSDIDSLAAVFTSYAGGESYSITSYPDYEDLRDRNRVFTELAAVCVSPIGLRVTDRTEIVIGELVSFNYFSTLGVAPALGRAFLPEEDETEGTHPVAILSHRVWQRDLAADPEVIGREVLLNSFPFTVVGVAPPGFRGMHVALAADVWVPLHMVSRAAPFTPQFDGRIDPWLRLFGRLKPGVGLQQAGTDMDVLAARLLEEHPRLNQGKAYPVLAASESRLGSGPDPGLERLSLLLMSIVGLVLLIAAFNVANLYLARATARQREIALRYSLGASRSRIVRQLLTESVLLALVAGAVGLLVATWTLDLLDVLRPQTNIPIELDLSFDPTVLAYALLLSLLTAMIFGLAPAVQTIRPSQAAALRDQPRLASSSRRTNRLQTSLVGGQVALSLVLLVAAGLSLRSLRNSEAVNPGFALREGLLVEASLGYTQLEETEGRAFYRRFSEGLESLPGVSSVAAAAFLPFGDVHGRHDVYIEGYDPGPEEFMTPLRNMVDESYFETLAIPIVAGRIFTDQDREDSLPVAIINETMARRYWSGRNPLGGRIRADLDVQRQVVGVVADGKYRSRLEDPQPYLYIPLAQSEYLEHQSFILATEGDPSELMESIRQLSRELDPELPDPSVATIEHFLDRSLGSQRGSAVLVSTFGLLALLLAMVGVYGVMAYVVSQRTHEYAVRMALGARRREIIQLVLRRGIRTTVAGVAVGLLLALVMNRALQGFLYGVNALDLSIFLMISMGLIAVAMAACYIPARWASRVDPMVALRAE